MTDTRLTFLGWPHCRRASSNRIPDRITRGRSEITSTRFVGGLLNSGRHLFWHRLQPIIAMSTLHQRGHEVFTLLRYREYGTETGGIIDGVRLRHLGRRYDRDGKIAGVNVYQPRVGFGKKAHVRCVPWWLYFIYEFEGIYVVFRLNHSLHIPHHLLPTVHTRKA